MAPLLVEHASLGLGELVPVHVGTRNTRQAKTGAVAEDE